MVIVSNLQNQSVTDRTTTITLSCMHAEGLINEHNTEAIQVKLYQITEAWSNWLSTLWL